LGKFLAELSKFWRKPTRFGVSVTQFWRNWYFLEKVGEMPIKELYNIFAHFGKRAI